MPGHDLSKTAFSSSHLKRLGPFRPGHEDKRNQPDTELSRLQQTLRIPLAVLRLSIRADICLLAAAFPKSNLKELFQTLDAGVELSEAM